MCTMFRATFSWSALSRASLAASCCDMDRCAVQLPRLNASDDSEKVRPAWRTIRRSDTAHSESAGPTLAAPTAAFQLGSMPNAHTSPRYTDELNAFLSMNCERR